MDLTNKTTAPSVSVPAARFTSGDASLDELRSLLQQATKEESDLWEVDVDHGWSWRGLVHASRDDAGGLCAGRLAASQHQLHLATRA